MIGETVGVIRPTVEADRYQNSALVYGAVTHSIRRCAFDGTRLEINRPSGVEGH